MLTKPKVLLMTGGGGQRKEKNSCIFIFIMLCDISELSHIRLRLSYILKMTLKSCNSGINR